MKTIQFTNDGGDFSALYLAEAWLRSNGYCYGSMESGKPIGIAKDVEYVSKWSRMTDEERRDLDGRIESYDFRGGTVTISLKEKK